MLRILFPLLVTISASAAIVTVNYSGTIHTSTWASVPVGSSFSGTVSYDTTATGTVFGGPYTRYNIGGMSFAAGTESGTATAGYLAVFNDLLIGLNFQDSMGFDSLVGVTTFSPGLAAEATGLNMPNRYFRAWFSTNSPAPGGPLSSFALPDPFPNFSQTGFEIGAYGSANSRYALGTMTFVSAVPEPSFTGLMVLGLAAGWWRRRCIAARNVAS
jgi:hypothetical protein